MRFSYSHAAMRAASRFSLWIVGMSALLMTSCSESEETLSEADKFFRKAKSVYDDPDPFRCRYVYSQQANDGVSSWCFLGLLEYKSQSYRVTEKRVDLNNIPSVSELTDAKFSEEADSIIYQNRDYLAEVHPDPPNNRFHMRGLEGNSQAEWKFGNPVFWMVGGEHRTPFWKMSEARNITTEFHDDDIIEISIDNRDDPSRQLITFCKRTCRPTRREISYDGGGQSEFQYFYDTDEAIFPSRVEIETPHSIQKLIIQRFDASANIPVTEFWNRHYGQNEPAPAKVSYSAITPIAIVIIIGLVAYFTSILISKFRRSASAA